MQAEAQVNRLEKHLLKNTKSTQSLAMLNRAQKEEAKKGKLPEAVHTHCLPHAMVDERSTAGHAAYSAVFQLQL